MRGLIRLYCIKFCKKFHLNNFLDTTLFLFQSEFFFFVKFFFIFLKVISFKYLPNTSVDQVQIQLCWGGCVRRVYCGLRSALSACVFCCWVRSARLRSWPAYFLPTGPPQCNQIYLNAFLCPTTVLFFRVQQLLYFCTL